MKLHGVVKSSTIELEGDPELPDDERALVELRILKAGIDASAVI